MGGGGSKAKDKEKEPEPGNKPAEETPSETVSKDTAGGGAEQSEKKPAGDNGKSDDDGKNKDGNKEESPDQKGLSDAEVEERLAALKEELRVSQERLEAKERVEKERAEAEKEAERAGGDEALLAEAEAELGRSEAELRKVSAERDALRKELEEEKAKVEAAEAAAANATAATSTTAADAPADTADPKGDSSGGDDAALREEIEKWKKEAADAKEEATKAKEEATKAKEEATKAKEEAAKAKEEAAKAKEEATKAKEEAAKAKEEAAKAKEEAAKAKEEASKSESSSGAAAVAGAAVAGAAVGATAGVAATSSSSPSSSTAAADPFADGTLEKIEPQDGTAGPVLVVPTAEKLAVVRRYLKGDLSTNDDDVNQALLSVPRERLLDWWLTTALHVRRLTNLVTLTNMSTRVYEATGEIMLKITTEACELLNATRATVWAADRQERKLYSLIANKSKTIEADVKPKVDTGLNRRYKPRRVVNKQDFFEIRIAEDEGIVGQVYTSGEAMVIDDAYESSFFNPDADKASGFRTKAVCCVPLIINGERLGSLQVINPKSGGTFSDLDVRRLESLATGAAVQLSLASVIREARVINAKNPLIRAVGVESLDEEVSLVNTINATVEDVKRVLDCEKASVFILDEDGSGSGPELFTVTAEGHEIRFPATAGLAGECFTKREPINIPNPYEDPRFNQSFDKQTGYRTRSILCMPLFSRDLDPVTNELKIVGVVQALSKGDDEEEFFEEEDELYFQRQVSHAGANISFAKLYEAAGIFS